MAQLEIYNNEGGYAKRVVSYMKADWNNYFVYITDLSTNNTWQYDQYHKELDIGNYSLQFVDQEGNNCYTYSLKITPQSPAIVFIVFSYSRVLMLLTVKEVSASEIDDLSSRKRFTYPLGYK